MAVHWGYIGEKGPAHWCDDFPDANGNRQSPIDIVTKDAKVDSSLGPLNINYSSARSTCTEVINNGHTFQVNAQSSDTNLSGGPLSHNYRLAQFHCHWGSNDGQGSEHTVDGRPYDAELHLVHWNTDLFQSVGDALPKDKGLAVLTAFLKVGQENTGWSKLVALLNHIKCKDDKCCIEEGFDPSVLLPENKKDYWTYEGSLTTPPCHESVRFIIFREPVEISPHQIASLRDLLSHKQNEQPACGCQEHLSDNYRPTMPLNGRVVTASFQEQ
ncbi:carbonic anhydrase 1-like isoform X1 [Acanthaster planci]|uniref:Carbonic anhydrase n=1 Tax=Acanthaster planci TaxID=133434 RepID=A0A8B7YXN0_ACAPL|nr:carbonic anhydrase 1-like isoform X1 [Acanthaster planci]